MKLPIANCRLPIDQARRLGLRRTFVDPRSGGFTMIEIALCLAIIGFALVSILLVLPSGMNTQRDTRQETIIGQDAAVLLEAIRDGARGMDDLTNYVYAITNNLAFYDNKGSAPSHHNWVYTYNVASYDNGPDVPSMHLTNGLRIIGLLSTPEMADGNGVPIPSLVFGGTSNHVVAYIRSFSGLATEKPPQDNQIMQEDAFSYRVLAVNAPVAMDTNVFNYAPFWQSQPYKLGNEVFYNWVYWQANADTSPGETPGISPKWTKVPFYPLELVQDQRELRLLFMWPQLPNGNVGNFRQNFRTSIAGQLVPTNYSNLFAGINTLYFYEPQNFTNAP